MRSINVENTSKLRKIISILILGVAGGGIYLIPYIRYVFYDWQIAAMGITNAQLGFLTTMYTIGNVLLYIPGGIISDKFSTKKSMLISLLSTAVLTGIFALKVDSYGLALVIWLLFAITTTFLFWCSLMKTIRIIAGEDQGFFFGLYYMGNGLTGAFANAMAIRLSDLGSTDTAKFQIVVWVYAAVVAIAFLLILFFLKADSKGSSTIKGDEFEFKQVGELLKNPTVWIFSLIVFTGYAIYSSTSYFTPYMTDVVGITAEESGYLSIIRQFVFYILSPVSGFIADRVVKSTSKWFMFLFTVLAALFVGVMFIPASLGTGLISLYSLLPGLFGLALYGIVFSIANEARIPAKVMGTAVGIASIIGYAPDFFMATMFGTWLDKFGSAGYNYIFTFLAVVCVVGLVASGYIFARLKKAKASGMLI